MNRNLALCVLLLSLLISGCTTLPSTSFDGLTLVPDSNLSAVYIKADADFSDYKKVILTGCSVAFRKNWQRDQNSSRVNLSSRLDDADVENIKRSVSELCANNFITEVEASSWALTDKPGPDVLIIKPSIINLDVSAPDTNTPGITRTYTTSAGRMSLFLEIYDASSGEILARVVDNKRAAERGYISWTNSVTNTAEANRMVKRWAVILREALDEVKR